MNGFSLWMIATAVAVTVGVGAGILYLLNTVRFQRRELQLLRRQASVGRLSTGVVHEINNPLTSMIAGLSIMRRTLEKDDFSKCKQIYEEQKKAADRITNIVRGLSMYARIDGQCSGRIDLHALIFEIVTCLECIYPKTKISFELSLKSKHPFILGKTWEIQQLLMDRLVQAAGLLRDPAMPRTETKREQRTIVLETMDQDRKIILKIGDQGSILHQAFPLWEQ